MTILTQNPTLESYIERYKALNIALTFGNSQRFPGMPTVLAMKIVTKAIRVKPLFNYRFQNFAKLANFLVQDLFQRELIQSKKNEEIAKYKEAKANFVNPFKVGEIYYDSWGYEQTNIDFYQIVHVGAKSVKIRKISQIMVKSAGYLCEYVKPDIDNFIDEEETKIIQLMRNGQPYIKSRHGCISKYDGREQGIYQSHYA